MRRLPGHRSRHTVVAVLAISLAVLGASCGANDCSSACQRSRGLWTPQTACSAPELTDLRWEVEIGTTGNECRLTLRHCEAVIAHSDVGGRDCASGVSVF